MEDIMEIRFAERSDLQDIITISNITHKEHYERLPQDFNNPVEKSLLEDQLRNQFPKGFFEKKNQSKSIFVCKDQNKVVGHIYFREIEVPDMGRIIFICDISVLPKNRNKGAGKKLLQHLVEYGKSNNVRTFIGEVWAENPVSEKLFKQTGFVAKSTSFRLHNMNATKSVKHTSSKAGFLSLSNPLFWIALVLFLTWLSMLLTR